jgi:hypothetical protein
LVEPSPAVLNNLTPELRRALVETPDGTVVHQAGGGDPAQVTQSLLAAHPDARLDPNTRALTLPPINASPLASATTPQQVGAQLAQQLGVSKVTLRNSGDDVTFDGEINPKATDILKYIKVPYTPVDVTTALANAAPTDAKWAAMFATAGKRLMQAPPEGGDPIGLTLSSVLGARMTLFEAAMRTAITQTINAPANAAAVRQRRWTPEQVATEAAARTGQIVAAIKDQPLYFIRPTSLPRNVASGELVRINAQQTRAEALYHGIAEASDQALLNEFDGQLHHVIPLYLGGGHAEGSLVQAEGMARIETDAHGILHNFIDNTVVANMIGAQPHTPLEWNALAQAFPGKALDLLIGELQGPDGGRPAGTISYRKVEKENGQLTLKPT